MRKVRHRWLRLGALLVAGVWLAGCGRSDRSVLDAAAAAYNEGRHERAVELLEQALKRDTPGLPKERVYNVMGLAYAGQGQVERAMEAFRSGKEANAEYFDSAYNLGVLLCEQGQLSKGAVVLEEAAALDPADTRALEYLAAAYRQVGRTDAAHATLKEALGRRKTPRILTALALTGQAREGSTYASTFLDQALAMDRHYEPALYSYGVLSEQQEDYDNAVRYYERYIMASGGGSRARQAQDRLTEMQATSEKPDVAVNPLHESRPGGSGDVVVESGQLDAVDKQLENLLEMARREVQAGADQKALNLCLMAASAAQMENRLAAQERALRTATSLVPDSARAHFAWGRFLKQQDRPREAISAYRESARLKPTLEALNGLAASAIQCHDYQTALDALRRAVKVEPDNPDSLWALGLFYDTQLQKEDRARASFEEFVRKFPDDARIGMAQQRLRKLSGENPHSAPSEDEQGLRHQFVSVTPMRGSGLPDAGDAGVVEATGPEPVAPDEREPPPVVRAVPEPPTLRARRLFNQAVGAEEAGQARRALGLYQQAIDLDPGFAAPHNNRGILLHRQGDLRAAAVCYRRALEADASLLTARYHLGLAYHGLGQAQQAVVELQQVLRQDPNHGATHYLLGIVFSQQPSTHARARAHYRRFVNLMPQHEAVASVRQWLATH